MASWNHRFFESTRGRIVQLLRRASHTVDELAPELGLTDNAIRAHLATLERDGLVRQSGVRRGAGKPSYAYGLTDEAEFLFPRPYGELLGRVLTEMAARHGTAETRAVLTAVGRELAATVGAPLPGATLEERLEGAVQVLSQLGGLAEVRREEDHFILQGYDCPLRAIVPDHPESCQLALALVQGLLGTQDVVECCQKSGQPACAFHVRGVGDTGQGQDGDKSRPVESGDQAMEANA